MKTYEKAEEINGAKLFTSDVGSLYTDKKTNSIEGTSKANFAKFYLNLKNGKNLEYIVRGRSSKEVEEINSYFPLYGEVTIYEDDPLKIVFEEKESGVLWVGLFVFLKGIFTWGYTKNAIAVHMNSEALMWEDSYVLGFLAEGGEVLLEKFSEKAYKKAIEEYGDPDVPEVYEESFIRAGVYAAKEGRLVWIEFSN